MQEDNVTEGDSNKAKSLFNSKLATNLRIWQKSMRAFFQNQLGYEIYIKEHYIASFKF